MAQSVARNKQYRRGGLSIRQRHNERQNEDYMNDDIIKDRAAYNVHFKEPTGSYTQMFDAMLADGTISTRGLLRGVSGVHKLCLWWYHRHVACWYNHHVMITGILHFKRSCFVWMSF